jgi:UDPglucose 6-dehydrogenase
MVQDSNTIFIAVGTPSQEKTGAVDLSHLCSVALGLAPLLNAHRYLVIKSTVPVGTSAQFNKWLREANPLAKFTLVSNPEFLREGMAVSDFLQPDRVLIGVETPEARAHMENLYAPLSKKGTPLLFTNIVSAELIKYAANGFLATKIAFVNEMASLCDALGANIEQVVSGIGTDKRIGPGYLQPGPGFGGSCFPKDTLALQNMGRATGMPLSVIEGVIVANNRHKQRMVDNITHILGQDLRGRRLAIWGLAFKAGTDDTRESAAVFIVKALLKAGATLQVIDPVVTTKKWDKLMLGEALQETSHLIAADSCSASIENADGIVVLTEWDLFKTVDWGTLKKGQESFIPVIDFRNLYDPIQMANLGIRYISLGRPSLMHTALSDNT